MILISALQRSQELVPPASGLDVLTVPFIVIAGVLGLVIGSFLNVVIWRVPRGESIVHPPSACPRCGTPISARDNIPVVSWLILRGRCRHCSEPISPRYPLVEAGTALAFVAVAVGAAFGLYSWVVVPASLYLAAISIALGLIDIDTHLLPNRIVLPSYLVVAALLVVAAVITGEWDALLRVAIGCAALFLFYFVLLLIYPAGMGFGDVKLAGVLGLALGWMGWPALIVGGFAAFLLGGIFSIALLATRKAGRKSGIPFGPWMLLGAWVGIFFGDAIATGYLSLVGLI
ncbi:prepilin peptidase [Leifsonia flava]|uniref:Prepilin leader peptidase/N-methyltransferase n=1 Tax=Orlajensenia leifsoniae TaxID=2561933 RepID=A0A4Y9R9B2_9MICO|nr:A24 family peptidase [Leifsonia flava]TFW00124.1 prepilin peptidase [Leifsonia flava]